MNRDDIKKILPHREPMLLLDDAAVDESGAAVAHYLVKGDEFFLSGHFPGNPIVPGVIQCEILAQSACVLFSDRLAGGGVLPMYAGLDNVRFHRPVRPGDLIETRCEIVRSKHPFYFAKGSVSVDGNLCTRAEFSFVLAEKKE